MREGNDRARMDLRIGRRAGERPKTMAGRPRRVNRYQDAGSRRPVAASRIGKKTSRPRSGATPVFAARLRQDPPDGVNARAGAAGRPCAS